jgi:predicted SAM-dependent methyltransferase
MIKNILGRFSPKENIIKLLSSYKYINLGCGSTFHNDWDNFDLFPVEGVRPIDLLAPLPFENESVKACYSSHVLEHFTRSYAPKFLAEIFRVLSRGGIVRIVVPDLEQIARLYLNALDGATHNVPGAKARHEWMTMELLDQMTRTFSGGFMGRLWMTRPLDARSFIEERLGQEASRWIERFDMMMTQGSLEALVEGKIYDQDESTLEEVSLFRGRGEVHQWMYDRISLKNLFREVGFSQIKECAADESSIPFFDKYHLDKNPEGKIRKPDSLFMEAIK